jgi:hypothetical protein
MKRDLNIIKEDFIKAKTYIFTIANITRNGITGYNFYLLNEDGSILRVVGGSTWNDKKGYHHNTAWGLDRALDILLSIASDLGLNFHDVHQSKMVFL